MYTNSTPWRNCIGWHNCIKMAQPEWWNHPYLKVENSDNRGRYVITTEDIEPLQGIMIENPVALGKNAKATVQINQNSHVLYPVNNASSNKKIGESDAQSILDFNQFEIGKSIALYLHTSFLNHSCLPNVSFQILGRRKTIVLNALRKIKKGEELCISYFGLNIFDKSERRKQLNTWFPACGCSLCEKPGSESTEAKMKTLLWPLVQNNNIIEHNAYIVGVYVDPVNNSNCSK